MLPVRYWLAWVAAGPVGAGGSSLTPDAARPGFHYTRPLGWQNDPVPFQGSDGTHHLFTLCNPNATTQWEVPSDHTAWCHASSAVRPPLYTFDRLLRDDS